MKFRTCDYCGTEYDAKQSRCPRCGSTFSDGTSVEKRMHAVSSGGARVAQKKEKNPERIPRWLWTVICCVLGLAVLIGVIAFILGMGYFEEGFDLNAIPTNMEQADVPVEDEIYPDPLEQKENIMETEEEGSCTGLELSQDEIILEKENARVFLTAVPSPAECVDEVVFSSADEEIVSVDEKGVVTAIAPGETSIIVTCGEITSVCRVVCDFEVEVAEEEIIEEEEDETEEVQPEEEPEETPAPTVSPDDFTLFYPGEEAYLTVKNVPDGASVSCVSSNAGVVTVTEKGKVTAVGNGQATITITVGDVTLTSIARCNLNSTTEGGDTTTAEQSYTGPFALNYTDVTFQFAGEKLTLKLTDAEGKTVSGLNWVTSNGAVCTVSGGTVTALGRGEAKVSTTYNGTTYTCIIRTAF